MTPTSAGENGNACPGAARQINKLTKISASHSFWACREKAMRRLEEKRMGPCRMESFPQYMGFPRGNPVEAQALLGQRPSGVTSFLRCQRDKAGRQPS